MIELLRAVSGIEWGALMLILFPSMLRAVWRGGATPLDKVLAAGWFLAINRVCFTLVSQYAAGEQTALVFCYTFAAGGAFAFIVNAISALRSQRRGD